MTYKYYDKMLPIQSPKKYYYEGDKKYEDALYDLLNSYMSNLNLNEFDLNKHHRVTFEEMSTPPIQLALLNFLIKISNTRTF